MLWMPAGLSLVSAQLVACRQESCRFPPVSTQLGEKTRRQIACESILFNWDVSFICLKCIIFSSKFSSIFTSVIVIIYDGTDVGSGSHRLELPQ